MHTPSCWPRRLSGRRYCHRRLFIEDASGTCSAPPTYETTPCDPRPHCLSVINRLAIPRLVLGPSDRYLTGYPPQLCWNDDLESYSTDEVAIYWRAALGLTAACLAEQ